MELVDCKYILWDFDGVLIDSDAIREKGFKVVLRKYPQNEIEQLLAFHRANGGLSRYVKFRFFFESIRKEATTESQINMLSEAFSEIMREEMSNSALLIPQSIDFVKSSNLPMHIVSGSDQLELRFLCKQLGIDGYFQSIHGSPTPKVQLIAEVLDQFRYSPRAGLMIGDSINDFEAADRNGIAFLGFGNENIKKKSNVSFDLK